MKKTTFVCIFLLLSSAVVAAAEEKKFFLRIAFEENVTIKSARLLGGHSTEISADLPSPVLTGFVEYYGVYTLSISYFSPSTKKQIDINMPVFLQPGETRLLFRKNPEQYTVYGASSANQLVFKKLRTKDEALIKAIQAVNAQLKQYDKQGNKIFAQRMKDSLHVLETKRREQVYGDVIRNNPNSIMALYALTMYGYINMENPVEVEKMTNMIADSLQQTAEIVALKQQTEKAKKIMVGQPAPVFSQADTAGNVIHLTDLQGQYVLVDFWASWCKPCRAQNPSLKKLYNKFRHKGFTVLGVSLDGGKQHWVKAINEDQLEWLNISDLRSWKNEAAITYQVTSVPQNYLLDKKGTIIAKNLNEEELTTMLEQLTSKN